MVFQKEYSELKSSLIQSLKSKIKISDIQYEQSLSILDPYSKSWSHNSIKYFSKDALFLNFAF